MDLTIKLKKGLGDIAFGMPVEEVVKLLGTADEVENIDNAADESTTVLRYNDEGLTLVRERTPRWLASTLPTKTALFSGNMCLTWMSVRWWL